MSLTSGFYNAINSDRRYDAEQMSQIFDGIINDGIYDSIGTAFAVVPASGMTVNVGSGRAWLNHTWVYNDTIYPITLTASSASLGRKDVICIKIDRSVAIRAASIVVIKGTSASSPVEPTVPADDPTNGVWYHKIATITVSAGTTSISAANIQSHIGFSTGTPYVTGIIASATFDQLWNQLEGEFNDWWENEIKPVLNPEAVTQLQNNIDHISPKESTMRIFGFSHQNPPPSGYTYQEYSTDAILVQINSILDNVWASLNNKINGLIETGTYSGTLDPETTVRKATTSGTTVTAYGMSGTYTFPITFKAMPKLLIILRAPYKVTDNVIYDAATMWRYERMGDGYNPDVNHISPYFMTTDAFPTSVTPSDVESITKQFSYGLGTGGYKTYFTDSSYGQIVMLHRYANTKQQMQVRFVNVSTRNDYAAQLVRAANAYYDVSGQTYSYIVFY